MKLCAVILLLLGMLPWAGVHATETSVFRVTAKVVEFCDVTTSDLALDHQTAQSGAPLVRATCTPNATYLVGVTKGATPDQRKVVSGARVGNAIGMLTVGVGTGEPVNHTLFGGIPAAQIIAPVDSGDTVSVRVYY